MPWGIAEYIDELKKFLIYDNIGKYNSFEITEILGFHKDQPKHVTNIMSVLVAESSDPPVGPPTQPKFLNGKKRIELRGTQWNFGVVRYRVSTQQVLHALEKFSITGEWKPGTAVLNVGTLIPIPPQFVSADTTLPHPWNSVLKNNFWAGSYVLELFDGQKTDVNFLLDEPKFLKQLADSLRSFVKIGIDGLSDRLGNVIIQLPVTVVTTKLSTSPNGDFILQPIWHKATSARQLRVSCEKYTDSTVEGYGSADVISSQVSFPLRSHAGASRYILWDDTSRLILAASAGIQFITSASMNVSFQGSIGTREFYIPLSDGTKKTVTLPLIEENKISITGKAISDPRKVWRDRRIFRDSLKGIRERREFVQYGGNSGSDAESAFEDIHALLIEHGRCGAWLWDPYLDTKDILTTLFYCPHKKADLRALSAGAQPQMAQDKSPLSKNTSFCHRAEHWLRNTSIAEWIGLETKFVPPVEQSWQNKQVEVFKKLKGDCNDLHLEFRVRKGSAGWPFHDRFLIFPSDIGPAKAWSLGTSVNSFGKNHHILQKVADGELIRQAFLDLWEELSGNDYLVWNTL